MIIDLFPGEKSVSDWPLKYKIESWRSLAQDLCFVAKNSKVNYRREWEQQEAANAQSRSCWSQSSEVLSNKGWWWRRQDLNPCWLAGGRGGWERREWHPCTPPPQRRSLVVSIQVLLVLQWWGLTAYLPESDSKSLIIFVDIWPKLLKFKMCDVQTYLCSSISLLFSGKP